jgi:hypothetical protein
MGGRKMKRSSLSVALLASVVLAGCLAPPVDMAIIAVMENDNRKVEPMTTEEQMAFKPTKVVIEQSDSDYQAGLQEDLADTLRQIVSQLPGTEVVNTEDEADWVVRAELNDASTDVRKTGDDANPKWQLSGKVQGKVKVADTKSGEETSLTLNSKKSKTCGSQQDSESSSNKSAVLKDATKDAARKQKSALKRSFPMPMFILETKGARQYVKLNRGRIHKVQKGQKLDMVNLATGETVTGSITITEVNEETSWGKTDPSARIGALVGFKCNPIGR